MRGLLPRNKFCGQPSAVSDGPGDNLMQLRPMVLVTRAACPCSGPGGAGMRARAARLQANETARPAGLHGPTPEEVWRQRQPITARARSSFARRVCRLARETRQSEGLSPEHALPPSVRARLERAAISRALASHGYLEFYPAGKGMYRSKVAADRQIRWTIR